MYKASRLVPVLVLFAVLFLTSTAFAQWQVNGVNVSLSQVGGENVEGQRVASDGAGGILITWREPIAGNNDNVFVQRLDPSGNPMWTLGGVLVCGAAGIQFEPTVVSDGAGGAVVIWDDARTGVPGPDTDVYAQRVNASGIPQWTPDGVALCTAPSYQTNLHAIPDASGGAIVTWSDTRTSETNPDIYAQRINGTGTALWGVDGVGVCVANHPKGGPVNTTDGSGGVIVAWNDARAGAQIYAQRVNATGTPQWTANGILVSTAITYQSGVHLVQDGAAGAYVAWNDRRNGPDYNVYAQRLNSAGNAQWVGDVALCIAPDDQEMLSIDQDGAGNVYAVWFDRRNGGFGQEDVYAQRVTSSGTIQWSASGQAICTAPGEQVCYRVLCDGTNILFAWHDGRGVDDDIYVQKMNSGGGALWTLNGVAICTAAGDQRAAEMVLDGAGGAIVGWYDYRAGLPRSEKYAERVASTGQPFAFVVTKADDDGTPGSLRLAIAQANIVPGPQTISFNIPGAGVHTIATFAFLPAITDAVTIDGFTQPGASPNTNPVGSPSNAQIMIQLDGWQGGTQVGLLFLAPVTVRGLAIYGPDPCVTVIGSNVVVEGNYIGMHADGQPASNLSHGVVVQGTDCRVGGATAAARNVIGGVIDGIRVDGGAGGSGAQIYGNYIGVAPDLTAMPNVFGVHLLNGATGAKIGSSTLAITLNGQESNVIENSTQDAVRVEDAATVNNMVIGNAIFGTTLSAIDLGGDGPTYNDRNDADTGPNNKQNQPLITSVSAFQINGLRDGMPGQVTAVHFYRSPVCGGSDGRGNAFTYIGGVQSALTAFSFQPAQPIPPGSFITCTATDLAGNTSELTNCIQYQNTGSGSNVTVNLVDGNGTARGTATYESVSASGNTFLTNPYPASPPVSGGFIVSDPNDPSIYFDITTTASYSGYIDVCLNYDENNIPGPESSLLLVHYNGSAWENVTTLRDVVNNKICGRVTSLSPFVIARTVTSGVGDTPVPDRFNLSANVPNPFNPITIIRYDVPRGGADVNITIYDIAGRRVRELVKEHRAPGSWSIEWNGEDDRGARVASGVYFYRMRAGDFVETKKMVLLK